jgi:hypothetical protein
MNDHGFTGEAWQRGDHHPSARQTIHPTYDDDGGYRNRLSARGLSKSPRMPFIDREGKRHDRMEDCTRANARKGYQDQ